MISVEERGPRTFQYAGHTLSYEIHGRGDRVVVLLHGILLDTSVNRRLARSLADHGYRVVLMDLLGHGRSDRPRHAAEHRMDLYARHVVALLDHLRVRRAVLGGLSLGADVALQAAVAAPDRVQGLILEMPVLENAAPAAAMFFVPLLLALHYLSPLVRPLTSVVARLPRPASTFIEVALGLASADPHETAAVLHGVLLGPIAPTVEERQAIQVPTLVIGHRSDLLHPYSDAEKVAGQIPGARLVEARSIAELRLSPERLTGEVVEFLDGAWEDGYSARSG